MCSSVSVQGLCRGLSMIDMPFKKEKEERNPKTEGESHTCPSGHGPRRGPNSSPGNLSTDFVLTGTVTNLPI